MLKTFLNLIPFKRQNTLQYSVPLARPYRDWIIIAVVSIAVTIILAVLGVWMYTSVIETPTDGSSSGAAVGGPNPAQMREILSNADALSAEHAQLLAAPLVIPDPSK
ncbi:MAG TPA: hypothetical protein VF803_01435 [Candidatus Paceibacterota bacterium]